MAGKLFKVPEVPEVRRWEVPEKLGSKWGRKVQGGVLGFWIIVQSSECLRHALN